MGQAGWSWVEKGFGFKDKKLLFGTEMEKKLAAELF